MPSFDIVSQIDLHELTNAVDQTNREVTTRFDLKGTSAQVEQNERALVIIADTEFQVKQILDILHNRMSKRGIDILCLENGTIVKTINQVRQPLTVRQGVDKELARQLIKHIKDHKLKVQAQVQQDQIRVTGKKRDDLQAVIASIKAASWGLPLQFVNFRD